MSSSALRCDRPILMLVTEPGPNLVEIVRAAVAGGVDIVQWRDKTMTNLGGMWEILRSLRAAMPDSALLLGNLQNSQIYNFRPRGIVEVSIDGIHFPEGSSGKMRADVTVHYTGCGQVIRPAILIDHNDQAWITGESVHSVESAIRAEEAGADYLVAGTIFESPSHPGAEPAGLEFLIEVCRAVTIPVIAIGGITPENAYDCIRSGAAGVAVLSTIMRSADPKAAAMAYREAIDRTG